MAVAAVEELCGGAHGLVILLHLGEVVHEQAVEDEVAWALLACVFDDACRLLVVAQQIGRHGIVDELLSREAVAGYGVVGGSGLFDLRTVRQFLGASL